MRVRVFLILTLLVLGISQLPFPAVAQQQVSDPVHPRLWVRVDDLPRLRSWAVESNPFYSEGLALVAEFAKEEMDAGNVPSQDSGEITWEQYPTEMYAELFAFMSLIENDPAARDDYAQRARTLLMHVMNIAVQGASPSEPFRDPDFSTYDRSRWWGEGYALAVDWIYPYLTPEDKATIRTVFLRWIDENMNAATTSFNHPEPAGVYNDPALVSDELALRWSANNYYLSHMRNIGLMALSFDPADDPDGLLGSYLQSAIGAWLYRTDYLLRTRELGGFSPEGWEYGPESLGSMGQFLLALYTAGEARPDVWGEQVVWESNPFWNDVIPAYLHSLSPATAVPPTWDWIAPVYQPAWYGDGQHYWAPDFIGLFGPMGIYDGYVGNAERLEDIRWIQTHTPPTGAEGLLLRAGDSELFRNAIMYFLLFDPAAPPPTDPRPELSTEFFAPEVGRILARTSWAEDAAWFTFHLGWLTIDHQLGEGGQFEFYRGGEWLTAGRVGWDGTQEPYGCNIGRSDYHNTLALQNSDPGGIEDWLMNCYTHGSQWLYVAAGDGEILAHSFGDNYVYALGDMTALYNSIDLEINDILHASRSIVWLQPDAIMVYDRAISQTEGRFKRFWLNTPTQASVTGQQALVTTERGQQLAITTLLPSDATVSAVEAEPMVDEVAVDQPMHYRVLVEAPGGPANVRFLHVLQGADAGAAVESPVLIESARGTPFAGAMVGTTAVLFPVDLAAPFTEAQFTLPTGTTNLMVTGLQPGAGYDAAMDGTTITVRPGSTYMADSGGVVAVPVG